MTDALRGAGIQGLTLLNIGGGIGAVLHEMLAAGIHSATDIDVSAACLAVAKVESQRRILAERTTFQNGNFVDLADQPEPTDIIMLDRAIRCYDEMEKLMGLSDGRARKYLRLVYSRDNYWMKVGIAFENLFHRIRSIPFRAYINATAAVDALIMRQGLQHRFYQQILIWQVFSYERQSVAE